MLSSAVPHISIYPDYYCRNEKCPVIVAAVGVVLIVVGVVLIVVDLIVVVVEEEELSSDDTSIQ